MKVLETGVMPNGTKIQIEEWNEDYSFIPYGSTVASYSKSKVSHEGTFAPKGNEIYRFSFEFNSDVEARAAFNNLIVSIAGVNSPASVATQKLRRAGRLIPAEKEEENYDDN